ncbi:predicted protein [Phaeodactylum tricornutum CCAP 1055/1]|jgi:hypothetical protein|uniref:Transmembrane protein n=1 Tax=Phaeodactylum tricornutum (strain CCAP 1055/1) TaxID=556484 RepID=B7FUC6_PHATC|nr:predicted protein [Phaeodactylum tricornutum CCAP 1055/1]EEC50237.1 predicted protein [Phaeodactylum tricornutum CCAP 1055/1]|mmetsp:Transcript_26043/g.67093  ORF Transcript_26043/g.67093 Transcript_26043/m.67093 type:complete len:139 (-) Transcript_26043:49-465(-)|eukprot:XP_002178572.1 predicted protein [Phaeodactylum tricornutum CCAP 1055/1]
MLVPFQNCCAVLLLWSSLAVKDTAAFAPPRPQRSPSALYVHVPPPPLVVVVPSDLSTVAAGSTVDAVTYGIDNYLQRPSVALSSSSSTTLLSLEERKPPTAEEIAAKKRNFNLFFWGGGFVAPFLATFYYFGFKFWEK